MHDTCQRRSLLISTVVVLFHLGGVLSSSCDTESTATRVRQECSRYSYCDERWITKNTYTYITCSNVTLDPGVALQAENGREAFGLKFVDSSLGTVPVGVLNTYANLINIYLNNSQTEVIEPGCFSGLTNLKELYLQDNYISTISRGTLSGLPSLVILDISNNSLETLEPFMFNGLFALNKLNLSSNTLNFINETAFNFNKNLNTLDLSHNNLSILHEKVFAQQINMEYLLLENNFIMVLPSNIFENVGFFIHLDLSYNLLSDINLKTDFHQEVIVDFYDYGLIKQFKKYNLGFNRIRILRNHMFNTLTELINLCLDNNNIEIIHEDAFTGLSVLEILNLEKNNIDKVPLGAFRELKNLISLNLCSNHLTELQYGLFTGLTSLEVLNLADNKIIHFEVHSLYSLKNLHTIYIDENFISKFEVQKLMDHLPKLQHISMDSNEWSCQWLTNTINLLEKRNITIIQAFSFKQTNVYGIKCISENVQRNLTVIKMIENKISETIPSSENKLVQKITTELPVTYQTKVPARDGLVNKRPLTTFKPDIPLLENISNETDLGITMATASSKGSISKEEQNTLQEYLSQTSETQEKNTNSSQRQRSDSNVLSDLRVLLIFLVTFVAILIAAVMYNIYISKKLNLKLKRQSNISSKNCTLELLGND